MIKTIIFTVVASLLFLNIITNHNAVAIEEKLPNLQTYSLPLSLKNWQPENKEDYFAQIKPHQVGYLIWHRFPVKIFMEKPEDNLSASALASFQQWQKAVYLGIDVWNPYLSLEVVSKEEEGDIYIYRRQPELKAKLNSETGLYDLPRMEAATTSVKFYLSDEKLLNQKMTIEVNPRQTFDYLVSNIIHELGHALGIWGHSDDINDVMYYAQTKDIPPLSVRDINTLKKIYQQQTRLGGYLQFDN